jgi:hypothetical protein
MPIYRCSRTFACCKLHISCCTQLVELLLDSGADIRVLDKNVRTTGTCQLPRLPSLCHSVQSAHICAATRPHLRWDPLTSAKGSPAAPTSAPGPHRILLLLSCAADLRPSPIHRRPLQASAAADSAPCSAATAGPSFMAVVHIYMQHRIRGVQPASHTRCAGAERAPSRRAPRGEREQLTA